MVISHVSKSWDDPPRVTGGVVEAPRNGACLKGKEPFDRVLVEKFETEVENLETLEITGLFSLCSALYYQICRVFLYHQGGGNSHVFYFHPYFLGR